MFGPPAHYTASFISHEARCLFWKDCNISIFFQWSQYTLIAKWNLECLCQIYSLERQLTGVLVVHLLLMMIMKHLAIPRSNCKLQSCSLLMHIWFINSAAWPLFWHVIQFCHFRKIAQLPVAVNRGSVSVWKQMFTSKTTLAKCIAFSPNFLKFIFVKLVLTTICHCWLSMCE